MTDALRPPPEYAHLRWHWLIDPNGEPVPAGWEACDRWAMSDGFCASGKISYARGYLYWKRNDPDAIDPAQLTAANARIAELTEVIKGLNEHVTILEGGQTELEKLVRKLDGALAPFADMIKTRMMQDVLSFTPPYPELYVLRPDFDRHPVKARDFLDAAEARSAVPEDLRAKEQS